MRLLKNTHYAGPDHAVPLSTACPHAYQLLPHTALYTIKYATRKLWKGKTTPFHTFYCNNSVHNFKVTFYHLPLTLDLHYAVWTWWHCAAVLHNLRELLSHTDLYISDKGRGGGFPNHNVFDCGLESVIEEHWHVYHAYPPNPASLALFAHNRLWGIFLWPDNFGLFSYDFWFAFVFLYTLTCTKQIMIRCLFNNLWKQHFLSWVWGIEGG